jgi:hypothetical protein
MTRIPGPAAPAQHPGTRTAGPRRVRSRSRFGPGSAGGGFESSYGPGGRAADSAPRSESFSPSLRRSTPDSESAVPGRAAAAPEPHAPPAVRWRRRCSDGGGAAAAAASWRRRKRQLHARNLPPTPRGRGQKRGECEESMGAEVLHGRGACMHVRRTSVGGDCASW